MDDFLTITSITNERQKVAHVGLCTKVEALEWWKANRHRHHTWKDVKEIINTYYENYNQTDQAYNEIVALKQTGTIQWYLNTTARLNAYLSMTDNRLITIILNCIPSCIRLAMAQSENLSTNQVE